MNDLTIKSKVEIIGADRRDIFAAERARDPSFRPARQHVNLVAKLPSDDLKESGIDLVLKDDMTYILSNGGNMGIVNCTTTGNTAIELGEGNTTLEAKLPLALTVAEVKHLETVTHFRVEGSLPPVINYPHPPGRIGTKDPSLLSLNRTGFKQSQVRRADEIFAAILQDMPAYNNKTREPRLIFEGANCRDIITRETWGNLDPRLRQWDHFQYTEGILAAYIKVALFSIGCAYNSPDTLGTLCVSAYKFDMSRPDLDDCARLTECYSLDYFHDGSGPEIEHLKSKPGSYTLFFVQNNTFGAYPIVQDNEGTFSLGQPLIRRVNEGHPQEDGWNTCGRHMPGLSFKKCGLSLKNKKEFTIAVLHK